MEAQGVEIKKNILYQDNKSTILLENNGKRSSGKRTRAFNIRYFFLTDQIEKGNLSVEYCSTTEMIADYMSKPLQGKLFQKFKKLIMGHWSFVPIACDDRSVLEEIRYVEGLGHWDIERTLNTYSPKTRKLTVRPPEMDPHQDPTLFR